MGYSDMGKNRERLDEWLSLLDDVSARTVKHNHPPHHCG